MKLRNHSKDIRNKESDEVFLACNITEILLQDEFYNLLEELEVDVKSFYKLDVDN